MLGEREREVFEEPFAALDGLSMFACIHGFRDRPAEEEWRLVSVNGTCQGVS